MELRYEVPFNESASVVRGLKAAGWHRAVILPRRMGDGGASLSIEEIPEDRRAEVHDLVRSLASTANPQAME